MSSTAPLQAFTESALKSQKARDRAAKSKDSRGGRGAGGGRGGRSGGGSRDRSSASSSGRPLKKHRPNRKLPALEFDDVARADYLTGFRKRKNARKEAAREFLEKKAKEEAKSTRKEAREARAKQAQENVKAERVALGLGEDEDDMDGNDDVDMSDEDDTPAPPQEYETEEHFTTVVVEEWDPDADTAPAIRKHSATGSTTRAPRTAASDKDALIGLPASSARAMKREKAEKAKADAAAAKRVSKPSGGRSFTSAQPALPSTKAITDLLGVSTDDIDAPTATGGRVNAGPRPRAEMASARKAGKFRYESKLERAKAKAHISEIRQKRAEKRKQENADKKGKDGRRIKSGKAGRGLLRPASKKKS